MLVIVPATTRMPRPSRMPSDRSPAAIVDVAGQRPVLAQAHDERRPALHEDDLVGRVQALAQGDGRGDATEPTAQDQDALHGGHGSRRVRRAQAEARTDATISDRWPWAMHTTVSAPP